MVRANATQHPGRSAAASLAVVLTSALVGLSVAVGPVGPTRAEAAPASPSPAPTGTQAALPSSAPGAPDPDAQPAGASWPTADALRRDLQAIGFVFRVDPVSGDWRGWAPPVPGRDDPPALTIGGAAGDPAWAAVELDLLGADGQATALESALTGFWEVMARVPVPTPDTAATRAFIADELLGQAPASLASCSVRRFPGGILVARVDQEDGTADLLLAAAPGARDPEADLGACEPIRLPGAPEPGEVTSVRLAVGIAMGDAPAFQPAELEVEGELVTLVLTFTNDSRRDQSLTFRPPLAADTGLVAPGGRKLIVLRRLAPGDYGFYSLTEPDVMTGTLRVVAPEAE